MTRLGKYIQVTQTRKIELADPRERERDLLIEVLIGEDYYWRRIKDASTIRLSSSLALLPKKSGWILTGNRTNITANQIMDNRVTPQHSVKVLRRFCDLDTIKITRRQERSLTTGGSQILLEFRDSYRIEDGRTVVRFQKEMGELSRNQGTAERFRALQKRLQQDYALRAIYEEQMLVYVVKQ